MAQPQGENMKKHRCGGTLHPSALLIRDEADGVLTAYVVPGLVCDRCHEELIEEAGMIEIEKKSQTPTVVWSPMPSVPCSSALTGPFFQAPTNSSALVAA